MTLSLGERERRYKLIREEMAKQDLDVLVVIGRDGSDSRGDYRYLSGIGIVIPRNAYVVFPREEIEPVFILAKSWTPDEICWLKDIRNHLEPEKLVVEEVNRFKGNGGIGLVSFNSVPIPVYVDLVKEYGIEAVRDGADSLKRPRLILGEEEIECCRKSAKVNDDIYLYLKSIARPGLIDWDIWAQIKRMEAEGHCEYSMDLMYSGGAGLGHAPVGNVIAEGGRLDFELTPAYEGYYSQLRAQIWVSPYSAMQRKVLDAWEHGYQAAIEAFRPGSRACDVYWAATNAIRSKGCKEHWNAGHAMGLSVSEYFKCLASDETVFEPGMAAVLHVGAMEDDYAVFMGGTFVVTKEGREALNKVDLI